MSKGFCIPEDGHFVQLIDSGHELNGADHHFPVVNMKNWYHVDFYVMFGITPRAAAVITVESCSNWVDLAGSPTTATKVPFAYYVAGTVAAPAAQTTAGNDVWTSRQLQSTAATGIVPVAGVADIIYAISMNADELLANHVGFRLDIVNAGAGCLATVFAICSGGRFQGAATKTVLAI